MTHCDCELTLLNAEWNDAIAAGYGWLHFHKWSEKTGWLWCQRHRVYIHVELETKS